ncbi:MAG TPA: DUF2726 domain-containing protein [Planctomycetaceae bacterium]|nr:DUF2726 domain-containing protein [Planctomycetaceae bacterium]
MSSSEPQGCLAAILNLFGIRIGGRSQASDELPYRQRDDFLSASELSFYRVLISSIGGEHLVCPKVNLADIFFVARPNENRSYRNKIDRKHVDFLLCDSKSLKPILGIELDDSSHSRRDRQERDEFVDQVFKAAGLPILHVRAAVGYNPKDLADRVRQATAGVAVSRKKVADEGGNPACQKCGTQMILRTAKKGEQQGEQFWGCCNYPKCREVMKVVKE